MDLGKNISKEQMELLKNELYKSSHRKYTTGFYLGAKDKECLQSSSPVQTYEYMAYVIGDSDGEKVLIEQRNRFKVGEVLQVLSPSNCFNQDIIVDKLTDEKGEDVQDAKNVQQKLYIYTNLPLKKGDILRKKII